MAGKSCGRLGFKHSVSFKLYEDQILTYGLKVLSICIFSRLLFLIISGLKNYSVDLNIYFK